MDPDLIFRAYTATATVGFQQIVTGPCVLESAFMMDVPAQGEFVMYDGTSASASIIMQGLSLGVTEPMRFPQICVRLENGLLLKMVAPANRWTFIIAVL